MFDFNLSFSAVVNADELYDLIIIGGGPAGLTAGLYASRYKLKTLLLEKAIVSGGQLTSTEWVENYPGFPEPILGQKLAKDMETQAKSFGLEIAVETVTAVNLVPNIKEVITEINTFRAKTVLIATGSSSRKLGIDGELDYVGRGVSYCATCDGPFYPDKVVAVAGGGNSAFEESLFLAKYATKVIILHRGSTFKADPIIKERVFAHPKIEVRTDVQINSIQFNDESDRHLQISDSKTNEKQKLNVDGLFVFVGSIPNTELFSGQIELENGYIVTDRTHQCSVSGVWAAGDVQAKALRQVATAVGDGACAAYWIHKYIEDFDHARTT